jgi:hypothetical protein
VLLPLALSFQKHLKSPDTDQLAYQLGLKGRGSGTTSPHDAYKHEQELEPVLYDLMILIVAFRLTKTDAAKACAIKYGLSISEKRLINIFNERPEMKQFSMNDDATRKLQEHMSKQRSNYVQTFPPRARQLLAAGKRP